MFECLRLFRFHPALFLILIFLIFGLAGCRTAADITLEDARKITAVGADGIAPPPRAGLSNRLYNPDYLELVNKPCKDEPPVPVDIDRVIDDIAFGCQRGGARRGKPILFVGYAFCQRPGRHEPRPICGGHCPDQGGHRQGPGSQR